ncbi:MAG: hypothetical protein JEZ00_01175 [Anaerolineaceae bacterium]|nr:hypothetical protein [Anaerolineaceae bacterium]
MNLVSWKRIIKNKWMLIAVMALFFSAGHHFFHFWEKPVFVMALYLLVLIPIFIFISIFIYRKFLPLFLSIGTTKRNIYLISAILVSMFFTWQTFDLPIVFQKVSITPDPDSVGVVELLEVKIDGDVLDISKEADRKGWRNENGVYTASASSQPLTLTFPAKVNASCDLLFYDSSESIEVKISHGLMNKKIGFIDHSAGQVAFDFKTGYRGVPNWLFFILISLFDFISFFVIIVSIFLIQDIGAENRDASVKNNVGWRKHLPYLLFLLIGSLILHTWIALSIPLILDVDSPTFLQGAVQWIAEGNLKGVSSFRGPGTTFLFTPILLVFGRNPWGMKVLLHLLSIGCVFLGYRISWQLSKSEITSFITGILIFLIPELYIYSNVVMSDLGNIFFVAVFVSMIISAYQHIQFKTIFFAMIMGAFIILFRSENIVVVMIGLLILIINPIYTLLRNRKKPKTEEKGKQRQNISWIIISAFVALLPILWWSYHNYQVYNFFGLSDYASEVLYDGWVYFGDASGLSFSDNESEAMQEIQSASDQYPIAISDRSGVATGWEIFPSLIKAGYTRKEAFSLFGQASIDSITRDWHVTLKLFEIKIRTAILPQPFHIFTYPLPGEEPINRPIEKKYYDEDTLCLPFLIKPMRVALDTIKHNYSTLYRPWFFLALASVFFGLYRQPMQLWIGIGLIVLTRIFIPNMMGLTHWRYTVSAILLVQIYLANWLVTLGVGLKMIYWAKLPR